MGDENAKYGQEFQDIFGLLAAPFEEGEVKDRNQGGKTIRYISSRTVQNRFDDVVGPFNWKPKYRETEKGVVCTISVRFPNGEWLDKEDAGGYAGMADEGDNEKSGYSDAMKRSAVVWGVARYLYNDGVPRFARPAFPGNSGSPSSRNGGSPPPARSTHLRDESPQAPRRNDQQGGNGQRTYDPNEMPRNGRGMFAWCKEKQKGDNHDWVADVNAIGKDLGLPGRMVDWSQDDIKQAWDVIVGGSNRPRQPEPPPRRQNQPATTHTPRPGDAPLTEDDGDPDSIPF